MSKREILVLVEGEKTDVNLMEQLFKIYEIDKRHRLVPYKTSIHALYNKVFRGKDLTDIDFLLHLKKHETDPERKAVLDKRYTDIILLFDYDPQDPSFSAKALQDMLEYFVDSTDMGKLYLNYPMVEAFYHMKSIPDPDYNTYTATMDELTSGSYKSRVNADNRNKDYRKFAVNKAECNIVIRQNIEKAWRVAGYPKPDSNINNPLPEQMAVLNGQLDQLHAERTVAVLCTCAFYIVDYNPKFIQGVDW